MPKITFSIKDLEQLVGAKLDGKLQELIETAKGEIENVVGDEITVKISDTNTPWLWSVEGLARFFKGILGKEKGLYQLKTKSNPTYQVVVEKVNARPCIANFVCRGPAITENILVQLIQLQEKLSEIYGRKREKVSIGIYPTKNINWPITYKTIRPDLAKFIPLDFREELNLYEILEKHPKGKAYGHLLKDFNRWPILVDANGQILSFPPIINSETTGRVAPGDNEIFFDATGTDEAVVNLVTNIFASALADRGYTIFSCKIKRGKKSFYTPDCKTMSFKLDFKKVSEVIGVKLSAPQIKKLLEKFRYGLKGNKVEVPCYRQDIMDQVDIIEDIAIAYGYKNILDEAIKIYNKGEYPKKIDTINKIRELAIGAGYQEIFSSMLGSKELLLEKMRLEDENLIELANPMSLQFACVRNSLLPYLLDVFAKNKKEPYPQKIFEQGLVTIKFGDEAKDLNRIALATCHAKANFTEIKQTVEFILRSIGANYKFEEINHDSFIPGRVAAILVNDKKIGFFGEIAPEVLSNFKIEQPVGAAEFDLEVFF